MIHRTKNKYSKMHISVVCECVCLCVSHWFVSVISKYINVIHVIFVSIRKSFNKIVRISIM